MTYLVEYQRDQQIGYLRLNCPEKLNAINLSMASALYTSLGKLAADDEIKVIILSGVGRAFCAGGDVKDFAENLGGGNKEFGELVDILAEVAITMRTMRQLVISQVHGVAAGAGFGLALLADFCLVAEDTKFIPAFSQVGLASDTSLAFWLSKRLGAKRAAQILMRNETLSAEQLLESGLISATCPADELAAQSLQLAQELVSGPSNAFAAIKQQLWVVDSVMLEPYLRAEAQIQYACAKHPEFGQYLNRFLDNRKH